MAISCDELKQLEGFKDLTEGQLNWLLEIGECRALKKGEYVFHKGDEANEMFAVLEGKIDFWADINGSRRNTSSVKRGAISGLLPYSRLKTANGDGIAAEPSLIVTFHKQYFHEMEQRMPDFVQYLVGLMTNRVRDFTRAQQQNEKMASLGKLAAGLAHELNNPAAAISRTIEALQKRIKLMNSLAAGLLTAGIPPECMEQAADTISCKMEPKEKTKMSAIERSEKEEELSERLEEVGVEDPYEMAEIFLDSGMLLDEVNDILHSVNEESYIPMLEWTVNIIAARKLAKEIEDASSRISGLVNSIKSYSHMDRDQGMEQVNLQEGVQNTITMLKHKAKQKNITIDVAENLDLPKVEGYAGELNQVWTNLLDNAIDAAEQNGRIHIDGGRDNGYIYISIEDNGPGIPEEVQNKIFDPFFTTKGVGQGTGLGLDIVQRIINSHQGDIKLESQPGKTEFKVFLPEKQEHTTA